MPTSLADSCSCLTYAVDTHMVNLQQIVIYNLRSSVRTYCPQLGILSQQEAKLLQTGINQESLFIGLLVQMVFAGHLDRL